MSIKTSKMLMKCVGATLALCSAMAIAGGCCCTSSSSSAKKFMKKTMNKMSDVVDTLASFM
ncbi:MAG: hypothetical protein Q4C99_09495 [Clostridia bacterium]|nr:hypothetical protein [Clostridia bacterium]